MFPFVLPCFAPTAVPQVLAFCFRSRPFPFFFRFLSSASFPVLTTQPSVLPFPSSWPCLSVAFPVLRFFLSASPFSTFSSVWFPILLFRFPVLGFLFVSFHPFRFRSHSRSTGASLLFRFLSSASFPGFSACFPLSFVRFSLLLTTQPSALSFPFFPFSPGSGSSGACLSAFRSACFHASLSALVLSFLHFFSPSAVSPHSGYPSVSAFFLSVSGLFPLAFAFRFRLLSFGISLFDPPRSLCVSAANFYIILRSFHFVNNYFSFFANFFECKIKRSPAVLLPERRGSFFEW